MGNVILITNKVFEYIDNFFPSKIEKISWKFREILYNLQVRVLMESNFEPIPKIQGQLAFIGVKPQIVYPDTRYISFV